MDNKKIEKLLTLLRVQSNKKTILKEFYEENGNERMERYMAGEILQIEVVIMLLTDPVFFDEMVSIVLK